MTPRVYPCMGFYFENTQEISSKTIVFGSLSEELDFVKNCGDNIVVVYGLNDKYVLNENVYNTMINTVHKWSE